jgi:subtilisin family serine protease
MALSNTAIGAFIDGAFDGGAIQGRDVQTHGTHVSGIIGARPPAESGAFAGIAPGADLFVARIFTATGGGNQGDVANAIDALSSQFAVDIINMSLTGAPSAIEHDAVIMAQRRGTVCVCAAGNQNGMAVGYPAAYPDSIAVSAVGLVNTAPLDSMPALNIPTQPDRFGQGGLFLASFSNIGPQIFCASSGNGIISTIPTNKHNEAPYADMSGTSMASPLAAGALANLLSRDAAYQGMDRNAARAAYARGILAQHAMSIMINPLYQGRGLARTI